MSYIVRELPPDGALQCETCSTPLPSKGISVDISFDGRWTIQCWECPVPGVEMRHYQYKETTIAHLDQKTWKYNNEHYARVRQAILDVTP